ncbi:hypothetical protein ACLOJK_004296 [Asimina triloba]
MANDHLGRLHQDLLAQIMARVDGPSLAAAACTCSDLRGVAHEEKLWKDVCHATWPSTQGKRAQNVLGSSAVCFSKFYADAYPLIVYKESEDARGRRWQQTTPVLPSNLVSFVDVYYKRVCIFSKVLHGIPGANDAGGDEHACCEGRRQHEWFMDGPFRIDVLNYQDMMSSSQDNDDDGDGSDDEGSEDGEAMGSLLSVPFVEKKERGCGKLCRKLEENVRLSWVLLDTRTGRAVSLSSWKSVSVQRHWPSESDFLMRFGCVVPVEEKVMQCGPAECMISVRCRLLEREGCLKWMEISMQVEDKEGAHVTGEKSLKVLEGALGCERSRYWEEFEKGYGKYVKEKREVRDKKLKSEQLVDRLSVLSGIGVFSVLCFLAF